ncbi:MAG: PAS domain S-box protein, partial [Mariprofundaceae bacterium]|nr:PAS domain S-box protein [Mariprofundaceae bacterium]
AVHQDGRIVYSNTAAATMFGYADSESVKGIEIMQFVHPDYRSLVMQRVSALRAGIKSTPSSEEKMLRSDGSEFWAEVSCVLVEHNGQPALQVIVRDITERKQADAALKKMNDVLVNVFETMSDGFIALDTDMNYTYVNARAGEILGRDPADLVGKNYWLEYPEAKGSVFANNYVRALETGEQIIFEDYYAAFARWFENRIYPSDDGISIFFTDITARKLHQRFEQDQRHILEQIADSAVGLSEVLNSICTAAQAQRPGMMCSVLLLDEEETHLQHGAAPDLPEGYCRAIDGVAIGEAVGSCGTAAYRKERVIVSDIARDPLWADYKDMALGHGLAACWSEPVIDTEGKLLGTIAIYYANPRQPDAQDLKLIER